jgi:hypothetical protein
VRAGRGSNALFLIFGKWNFWAALPDGLGQFESSHEIRLFARAVLRRLRARQYGEIGKSTRRANHLIENNANRVCA